MDTNKRRSSEGCMLYLRLRLLRVLCLTRDPRNNEEWDPWQLSVTDFMIFKFNEFWVACNTIAKPLSYTCIYYLLYLQLLSKARQFESVFIVYIFPFILHLFHSFSLWPAACDLWPEKLNINVPEIWNKVINPTITCIVPPSEVWSLVCHPARQECDPS